MTRRIEIDGQDFDVLDVLSLEQELYLAGLIRRGTLDRIPYERRDSLEEVASRLMDAVEKSRLGRAILSTLIVPAGEPWSPEEAARTAAFIKTRIASLDDETAGKITVVLYEALISRGVLPHRDRDQAAGEGSGKP